MSAHKKAPSVGAHGALVDGITIEETHVMANNSTAVSNVIPFRSAKLLLVENGDQPFVPMKPVVEGMGLDWKTQYRKLQGGRFNSVMVMMTTTGTDGKNYEMACMPLRKLPGWLMSIHATKVRPELREGVIAFQNECDDVLWEHWNTAHPVATQAIGSDGLTPAEQRHVQQRVAELANHDKEKFASLYRSIKDHFMVGSYKDVPSSRYPELCKMLMCKPLDGSLVSTPEVTPLPMVKQRWLLSFDSQGNQKVAPVPPDAHVLTHRELIQGMLSTGEIAVSTEDMYEFAMAALANLKARSDMMLKTA